MIGERDERLREFATDRQWEILEALWTEGTERKAAEKLGIDKSRLHAVKKSVLRAAARQGYTPESDRLGTAPEGFQLKGKSTLYDEDGKLRLQWVKTTIDQERQAEFLRESAAAFASELPRADPAPAITHTTNADLLAAYPVGDHHFGMLSWGEETERDYDLKIAEQQIFGAFDYLTNSCPPAAVGLIPFLGDFMHYDSMVPVTPTSRNQLDADSRFGKMVRAAIRGMRYAIRAALARHNKVRVIVEIGNHDLASSIFLMEALANVYENDPRVEVDRSPKHFHYYEFGQCLIGTHHGHGVKLERLSLIMAADQPAAWGRTKHRYFYTGHIHRDRVIDDGGARVESFRILPPTDAWAHQKGYRPRSSMNAIVLHRNHGEVARFTVNPDMLGLTESAGLPVQGASGALRNVQKST